MSRLDQLRAPLRAARRRISSIDTVWSRALPAELSYWQRWIETGGLDAPQEFKGRLDPRAPILDPFLLAAIDATASDPVRIIDVGAGPMTSMGFVNPRTPARHLEVVAVDPLADGYAQLLSAAGVTPPVPTQACRGEDVATRFGEGAFDIAYARNSLDHAADPMAAIESVVAAVKRPGHVVLIHGRREGEARSYEELHQWNFDLQDGRLVLFGRGAFHDLGERLGPSVHIAAETFDAGPDYEWVAATLRVGRGHS